MSSLILWERKCRGHEQCSCHLLASAKMLLALETAPHSQLHIQALPSASLHYAESTTDRHPGSSCSALQGVVHKMCILSSIC